MTFSKLIKFEVLVKIILGIYIYTFNSVNKNYETMSLRKTVLKR